VVDVTAAGRGRGRRWLGGAAIGIGLLVAALSRVVVPAAPPLYDGVIVNEPYRWLEPPPGQLGGAQGFSSTERLEAGGSPLIAIQTPEQPPQASVFAPPGALTLPPGTTSLKSSITPIPAEGTPAAGHIAGNVYRIAITNQNDLAVTAPADAFVSVVLRGPEGTTDATIERFVNGSWKPLTTDHAGYTSGFLSIVTEFGDVTLVTAGSSETPSAAPTSLSTETTAITTTSATTGTSPGSGIPLVAVVIIGGGLAVLAGTAIFAFRPRRGSREPPRRDRRRRRR
jgi:hypothetical protein